MVVAMKREATEADVEAVAERVRAAGGEAFVSRGAVHTIIGLVGDTDRFQTIPWRQLPGVDHVIQIGKPYKMVAADLHPRPTHVDVGATAVGRGTGVPVGRFGVAAGAGLATGVADSIAAGAGVGMVACCF